MRPGRILELPIQRRAAVRYKLRLPVIFYWNDSSEQTEGGFTSDVALDGAFIVSRRCPNVGAELRIEILIPSPDESGEELLIECWGKVVRVSQQPGRCTFGVAGIFDDDHLKRHVLE